MISQALLLAFFPGLMTFAATMDLLTMTIPNRASLLLVAIFFPLALFAGLDLTTIALHASAALVVLLIGFSLFSFGFLGGGDAKILAAAALWFGWFYLLPFLVYTGFFGGILAVALLYARRRPLPAGLERVPWIVRLHTPDEGAPYGVAIAAAALMVYPDTFWFPAIA